MGKILFEGTDVDAKQDDDGEIDGNGGFCYWYYDQELMIEKTMKQDRLHWDDVRMSDLTTTEKSGSCVGEGVIVRIDGSVANEELGEMKL